MLSDNSGHFRIPHDLLQRLKYAKSSLSSHGILVQVEDRRNERQRSHHNSFGVVLDSADSGIATSSRCIRFWQHRRFRRAVQFFIERYEKAKVRPILRVTLLEPFLETRKGSEGRIQALQVEIVQGGAIDPCYAVASLEAPELIPDFSLLWLLGGTRPRLTESPLKMQETSDAVALIPHVPMLVALLVAERKKDTGEIDFGFGSTRFWLKEMKRDYDHIDMRVHLAGKELKDEKPTSFRFRLNLSSPWEEMGFVEIA